jgi:hypothetical protein
MRAAISAPYPQEIQSSAPAGGTRWLAQAKNSTALMLATPLADTRYFNWATDCDSD